VEDLPDEPLSGLRLVFLDMKLGTEGDDNVVTATRSGFFSRCFPNFCTSISRCLDKTQGFDRNVPESAFRGLSSVPGKAPFYKNEKPTDGSYAQADELRELVSAEIKNFYPAEILGDGTASS